MVIVRAQSGSGSGEALSAVLASFATRFRPQLFRVQRRARRTWALALTSNSYCEKVGKCVGMWTLVEFWGTIVRSGRMLNEPSN